MPLDPRVVIHANAKVIEMVEQAKFLSDRLIDELPGLFAVVRWDGEILRSNINLAELMGVEVDRICEKNILSLFRDEDALIFGQRCHDISFGSNQVMTLEFQIAAGRSYQFTIKRYGAALGEALLTVLGTDITEIREVSSSR